MSLQDDLDLVNLFDDRLTVQVAVTLTLCKDRAQRFIHDGMPREAAGAVRVLLIMWQCAICEEPINTGFGRL